MSLYRHFLRFVYPSLFTGASKRGFCQERVLSMQAFHEVRKYDGDFMAWHSAYDNMSFWAHWHEEIELILVRSGTARINVTDHAFTAREGDLILCDSGDIHYSDSYQMENRLEFIVFDPHLISSHYQYTNFANPLIRAEDLKKAGLDKLVFALFDRIPAELREKKTFYKELVKSLLREFWYTVRRFLQGSGAVETGGRRHYMLNNLQQLLNYIDENYSEPIALSQAAARMGFSDSHFSRFFKQYTGVNFVSYVQMIRVEQAINRLHDSAGRIVDIAYDCGFTNVRTFNRVFKQLTSHSPAEFCRQKDFAEYTFSLGNRKVSREEQVENDSIVVLKNTRRLSEARLPLPKKPEQSKEQKHPPATERRVEKTL